MKFDRSGIILYTIEYEKCVTFYSETLELNILFKTDTLTCFEFGNSMSLSDNQTYLMVELDSEYNGAITETERIKTCLRMNVQDVKSVVKKLKKHNVKVNLQEHSWGTVAKFFDPDGNLLAFKDSEKFEKQITNYKA